MNESDNIADPGKGGDQRNETSDIQDQTHLRASPVMREAASRAVRGARVVAGRANTSARGAAVGSIRAVGGIGAEAGALVRDAVTGVIEGTGQVVSITAPAVKDVVAGGIRGANAGPNGNNEGRNVVAGAIVGAESVGLKDSEAVAGAVAGAVEGMSEVGGDLQDTARVAVGGIVSGMAEAGGDVVAASQDATEILIEHAIEAEHSISEIAEVATTAVDAALMEADRHSELGADVVTAVAMGAVEAAYRIDTTHGDQVREAVLEHIAETSNQVAPGRRRRMRDLAEELSRELPQGRAAWRGRAMYRALLLLRESGGIDLAGSLAYFTILSLFPLVTLIIMGAIFLGDPQGLRNWLTGMLAHYFPASGDLINQVIGGLFSGSLTFGIVAVVGLLIGANGLLRATDRAVNRVFGARGRNVIRATLAEMALAALLGGLFLLSVVLTAVVYSAATFSDGISAFLGIDSSFIPALISTVSTGLSVALIGLVFALAYRHLPNARVEWRDATFGALIALALFELAKHAFFWFTGLATDRNLVYGPVASVVVLLMWAYIGGLIFLYGAALAKMAGELRPVASGE